MVQNKYTLGQLLTIKNLVVEVCFADAGQCSNCVALNKKALCRKLPECGNTFYFRKLNAFELRKAKREKKIIIDINSKEERN